MLGNRVIFAILLFSLSGLLVPPMSSQISFETFDSSLNDSIPLAYATSLTNIEKMAAYKIHLKIRVTEIPGELEEERKKGPTKSWYKTEAREKEEWEDRINKLEEEFAFSEVMLKKVCDWIDLYEIGHLNDYEIGEFIRKHITLPQTIGLAQSLTLIYLDMVQDILSGNLNIETFCKMLEFAIETAEAVGDDETAEALEEISEIAMAVKAGEKTVSDLKKALEDKKNTIGLGASSIFEDISDTESDDENLLAANTDTILPGWFKNNVKWVQQGLLPKSSLLPAIENLMIQNVIPIDRFIKPAGIEGNIGGGFAQQATQAKGYGISSAPISSSLPDYSVTVLGLWADGLTSSGEVGNHLGILMSSGIINSEKIQKEIIKRERQIDPPSLQLDSGPDDVDPKLAQLVFETATQNVVSMTYLQKIKSTEYEMIKNSYDIALSDYSENKDQASMNTMISLGTAEKKAKENSQRAIQIHKTAVQLAKDAKAAAVSMGLHVLDLEASVVDSQFEIDSMKNLKTESEIKSAYNDAQKSQGLANKGLQDVLLTKKETSSIYKELSTNDKNSVSVMINGIEYSDFVISKPTKPLESGKVWYVPLVTVEIEDLPCTPVPKVEVPMILDFIFGLKIPFAFGDDKKPCDIIDEFYWYFMGVIPDDSNYDPNAEYDATANLPPPITHPPLDDPIESVIPDLAPIYTAGFGLGPILDPEIIEGNEMINDDKDMDSLEDIIDGLLGTDDTTFENEPIESVIPELEFSLPPSPEPETETDDSATDNDGTTTETHPSGATTTTLDDGTTITTDTDGTITRIDPDGTKTVTTPSKWIIVTYPDGTSITTQPDGTTTKSNPDGSGYISYPDGTNVTVHPDGSTDTVNPDGTTTSRDPDGNITSGTTYDEPISTTNPDGTITTVYPDGTSSWLTNGGSKVTITYPDGTIERSSVGGTLSGNVQVRIGTSTWNFNTYTEAYAAVAELADQYIRGTATVPTGPYDPNQTYSLPLITADYGRQYPAYQFTIVQYSNVCNGDAYYMGSSGFGFATTISLGGYASVGNCGYGTVNNYPIQNVYIEGNMLNAYLNHMGLDAFPPVPKDTTGQSSGSSDPKPPSDSGLN